MTKTETENARLFKARQAQAKRLAELAKLYANWPIELQRVFFETENPDEQLKRLEHFISELLEAKEESDWLQYGLAPRYV